MKQFEKQKRIEQAVYEAIDDIAEEMNLKVSDYPEVYWVGRNLHFEDLFLNENYRGDFADIKNRGGSAYLDIPRMIFIGANNLEDITEEAAHFLHYSNSKIRFTGRSPRERFSLHIIEEMLAFFCSRLILPSRKNPYSPEPDLFYLKSKDRGTFLKGMAEKYGLIVAEEFYLYQQARGLAERVYASYILEKTQLKDIRKLFLSRFQEPGSASFQLASLKLEYWPPANQDCAERLRARFSRN